MEKKTFNKEEAEVELNQWKERIKQLRMNIEQARDDIKVDILGDLEKLENQQAVIKNKLIHLNEGKQKWDDIEASIGDALYQIKNTYNKANSKYNL
ncbi:MAG: hypothetical protein H0V01_06590 [Bacteroidetes bacterium]|nr:hypothetical protein [Bacteroidota bacterium]HET6245158.1 hypothetical protein [Bacteroidia bacterium]